MEIFKIFSDWSYLIYAVCVLFEGPRTFDKLAR